MIQFTSSGVEVTATPAQLAEAKASFDKHRMLHLPGLLSPELVATIRRGLAEDGFEDPKPLLGADAVFKGVYQGGKVGQDLKAGPTQEIIRLRTNDPKLLSFVETVIGSPPLSRCVGRVFRLHPIPEDLPWHTDAEGGRVADLIFNLSLTPHEGGLFQMREKESQKIFNEVQDGAFGDGLLIRISPHIEHHYCAITGTIPKITFSGWFVPKS